MEMHDEWQRKIGAALQESGLERIPEPLKRCPKCGLLTLEFDPRLGRISCSHCGLEVFLPRA